MAIWATKCDCCGERFCFLAVFKYPELEGHQFSSAKLVLHSQQPVGRGTLQFAHDFTSSTGIPVHSVPTGAGLGWSDTSRTRLHRIQLPAATERSEATYFPEGTPGGEEGESTTSDSILREAGNEVGRALEIWRAARRAARAEERPARAQKRPRRRLDRSTIVGRVLSYDDEILQGGGSVPDSQEGSEEVEV